MASPLGKLSSEARLMRLQQAVISIETLMRIRTTAGPHPTSLRLATFPKGEGFCGFFPNNDSRRWNLVRVRDTVIGQLTPT